MSLKRGSSIFFNGGVSKKYLILFSKEKCSAMPNFVTSLFEFKKFEFSTGGIRTPPPLPWPVDPCMVSHLARLGFFFASGSEYSKVLSYMPIYDLTEKKRYEDSYKCVILTIFVEQVCTHISFM